MKKSPRALIAMGVTVVLLAGVVLGSLSFSCRAEPGNPVAGANPGAGAQEPSPPVTTTEVYDIRYLLVQVPDFIPAGPTVSPELFHGAESGGVAGGNCFTIPAPYPTRVEMVDRITKLVTALIGKSEEWDVNGGAISSLKEIDGYLLVKTTAENHKQVARLLDQVGKAHHRKTLSYDVAFFKIKTARLQQIIQQQGKGTLVLDAKAAQEVLALIAPASGGTSGAAPGAVPGAPPIAGAPAAGTADKDAIHSMGTTRLVAFDGQYVWATNSSQTPILGSRADPDSRPGTAAATQPASETLAVCQAGATMEVNGTTDPDGGRVTVTAQIIWSPLDRVHLSPADARRYGFPAEDNVHVATAQFKTSLRIPNGGAVIFSSSTKYAKIGDDEENVILFRVTVGE